MVKVNYKDRILTLAEVGLKDDTYSQEGQSEFTHLLHKDSSCVGSDIGNCRQLKREYLHCKKLEVDLTLKRSSQLQCGFFQVQVVVQLLLQGFTVTPFAIEDV